MFSYLNGEFIEESEMRISPFDHGFLYGMGAFETFRTYGGRPYLLLEHITRLQEALDLMGIEISLCEDVVRQAIGELLERNQLSDGYFRVNVSAGVAPIGLPKSKYTAPNLIIFVKPLLGVSDNLLTKEAKILELRRNTPEGNFRFKSHHYLNNILGSYEIQQEVGVEGVFLTKEGYVAEGLVSNIFWVRDNCIFTPSLETGILNGITRQQVISILSEQGISVREGKFTLPHLMDCDEVFLTNSIQELVAVTKIDHKSFQIGQITGQLFEMYKQRINEKNPPEI